MSMADVLAVISGLILVGLAFPSLLLVITINFPQLVEHTSYQVENRPVRNIFRGLGLFFVLFIMLGFFAVVPGPGKLLALGVLLIGLSLAIFGAAGIVNLLANRYEKSFNVPKSFSSLAFSSIFLELAFVLPLVGWFVVLPISFLLALGAISKALSEKAMAKVFSVKSSQPTITPNNNLHPVS